MMHAWGAVDLRIYLAKKNHGYSISAQSYDFCPHLIKLDILDFTLHYVFSSIVALHSFRLKLCSVKYIVHCFICAYVYVFL